MEPVEDKEWEIKPVVSFRSNWSKLTGTWKWKCIVNVLDKILNIFIHRNGDGSMYNYIA